MSVLARLGAIAGLTLAMTSAAAASDNVSDGELQQFIVQSNFPIQCGDAAVSVDAMRARPTTDPNALHAMIRSFVACAKSPWTIDDGPLFNTAMFDASSASLLAARHESGSAAAVDASNVVAGTTLLSEYEHGVPPGRSARHDDQFAPSEYVTDANRIKSDAKALAETLPAPDGTNLPASEAVPALPDAPPPGHYGL